MSLTQATLEAALAPRYTLRRELGGGSMAVVYLAEDVRHGRPVAVKCLRPEYGASLGAERFLREIEIAAQLQHPHIVPLLDSGEAGGLLYLVMPYVEGESLRVRLLREGRLAPGEVIRIVGDVADALAHAHARGIVHRDIKPDNILLAGRHALVADFGVARAVRDAAIAPRELTIGVALGTPAYMAPEQATASPDVDERADLYALGVVAYELLTGATPFDRPTAQAMLTAQVLDEPVPVAERRPDVPPALAALVMRCLAKAPEARFQTAEELGRQLEPLLTPSGGSTPSGVRPVGRPLPRVPLLLGGGALAVAAVIGSALLARRPAEIGMSGTQRQITFTGVVKGAAVSPDGELLAFISDSGGRNRLMVQDFRGGQAILLSEGERLDYPSWSADGAEVRCYTYEQSAVRIRRVPRLGGAARDLPVFAWSSLSPDGTRLASLVQGTDTISIRNLSTGEQLAGRLDHGWWLSFPAWSPDGARLAWSEMEQGGRGSRIRMSSVSALAPVTLLSDSLVLGVPAWTPDGTGLFYLRSRGRVVDLMHLSLDAKGAVGPPEVIRGGLTLGNPELFLAFLPPPSLSGSGNRLVYVQRQDWSNLALAEIDARRPQVAPRVLTTGSASYDAARLSHDGTRIAAARLESEDVSLQVLPVEGGPGRELGRVETLSGLAWSPRGDRLAVADVRGPGGRGLSIWPLTGVPSQPILLRAVGDAPEWLDDTSVVIARVGNRSFQAVRVGGSTGVPLAGLDTNGWMFWPRRAPDGQRLAFAWNRGGGQQGVYLQVAGQAPARRLMAGLMNPIGWSADGARLFVADAGFFSGTNRLYSVSPATGAASLLSVFPRGTEIVDITPDGRQVLLNLHEQRADVWAIEFGGRH